MGLYLMIVGGLIMLTGFVLDVHIQGPSRLSLLEQRLEVLERDLGQLRASMTVRK